jgi:superfamily II DNA or RNA helicase
MNSPKFYNKINNFVNINTEPLNWVLPNRKEFVNWINQTFLKYRASGKPQPISNKFTPFKYQKLLRDYMQNNSPYRGILLYHSLGTGKTCTAITIAENLKSTRNVVVMLPASLRTNFIYDGLMFCGDSRYKNNPNSYKEKYSFISYNANNTMNQIKKIGSLDNKVIIIEEVHNLVSKMLSGIMGISKQGLEIYHTLMDAQNVKIVALSGTPLINDPFEVALLFNILRGYIEISYFRIVKVSSMYGDQWDLGNLEEELMKNNYIDYLEINKLNKSIEFHIKVKSYTEEYRDTISFIENICNNNGINVRFLELKKFTLFPIEEGGEIFRNYFVKEDLEKGDTLKNEEVFKRRILGLVSNYSSKNENYPTVIKKDYYRVEMSEYQFQIYQILRAKERLSEKGSSSSSSKKKSKNVKSTFRVFSRQASNFVFPEEINRPYPDPSFVVSILKNNENNKKTSLQNINKIISLEESANENGKISIEYKSRINNAIDKLVENGELYFTPGKDGLDKLSPKMKIILENIQKSPGLIFVYSNFRSLEGIELFSKVLDFNGFSKFGINDNKKKYAIYSGSEDEKEKKEILSIFTSNENKHGKFLKIILATSAGAEGLDLKNIRQIHIMEPYWNQMRIEQVIGRGVRRNSHIALPPNERNVEIFRYFSVFSKKDYVLSKDKSSTDEHIEQLSLKKQLIINQVIQVLKETSFDCLLNSPDVKGDYNCFSFGSDAKGFAYYPNISKDIIESYAIQNKKIVKRKLTQAVYFNTFIHLFDPKKKIFYMYNDDKKTPVTIDNEKAKIFYVDKDTNEVFDKKSTNAGNPIKIGFIIDSKIKKKK